MLLLDERCGLRGGAKLFRLGLRVSLGQRIGYQSDADADVGSRGAASRSRRVRARSQADASRVLRCSLAESRCILLSTLDLPQTCSTSSLATVYYFLDMCTGHCPRGNGYMPAFCSKISLIPYSVGLSLILTISCHTNEELVQRISEAREIDLALLNAAQLACNRACRQRIYSKSQCKRT